MGVAIVFLQFFALYVAASFVFEVVQAICDKNDDVRRKRKHEKELAEALAKMQRRSDQIAESRRVNEPNRLKQIAESRRRKLT